MSSGPISGAAAKQQGVHEDGREEGVSIRAMPPRTFAAQPPPQEATQDATTTSSDSPVLNKISRKLTQDPSRGGTRAFMHAIGFSSSAGDFEKAQVCISAVWFEGNPCNNSLNDMGKVVKEGVQGAGMVGFQTATVGVR